MPARGLPSAAVNRFAALLLQDECKVEVWNGKTNGVDQWEDLGTFNARRMGRSTNTHGPQGVSQLYDDSILIKTGLVFDDRNKRYRATVTENKSLQEAENVPGLPEAKRTRVYDVLVVEPHKDAAGSDILQMLRCKNGGVS